MKLLTQVYLIEDNVLMFFVVLMLIAAFVALGFSLYSNYMDKVKIKGLKRALKNADKFNEMATLKYKEVKALNNLYESYTKELIDDLLNRHEQIESLIIKLRVAKQPRDSKGRFIKT